MQYTMFGCAQDCYDVGQGFLMRGNAMQQLPALKGPPRLVMTGGELALGRVHGGGGLYSLCSPRFEPAPEVAVWADWVELAQSILFHEKRRVEASPPT